MSEMKIFKKIHEIAKTPGFDVEIKAIGDGDILVFRIKHSFGKQEFDMDFCFSSELLDDESYSASYILEELIELFEDAKKKANQQKGE